MCFFKPDDNTVGRLISQSDITVGYINYDAGNVFDGSGNYQVFHSVWTQDTWNHNVYSVSQSDGSGKFYIDGELDLEVADTKSFTINNKITIGVHRGLNADFFNGLVEHVRAVNNSSNAHWIKADYYAQTDNFITWGDIEYKV